MGAFVLRVPRRGLCHEYFSAEKFRDPDSRRRAPSFKSVLLFDYKQLRPMGTYIKSTRMWVLFMYVPRRGLEPPILTEHEPQSCAYTNSATWAYYT